MSGFIVFVLASNLSAGLPALPASAPSPILGPRDYHLQTELVLAGKPRAVIVIPRGHSSYEQLARDIVREVGRLTGVELEVHDAEQDWPEELLRQSHVIALGNLTTNRFIELLYWQWYTLLDLWYPGPGGYVLRTLHDPFGVGHNVVLLGGSDEAGVHQAAELFCRALDAAAATRPAEETRRSLVLGTLMDIRLGAGHEPTPPGAWIDPRLRVFREDRELAYGYTAASRAGLIYHYNGDERFAKKFRELALGTDVLTATNHYNAHMHAIVWDLIEESPVFSDEDRRSITAKLLAHASGPDGSASIAKLTSYPERLNLLDRHTSMQAICTLTESRYFGKYWPAPEWKRNLQAVRTYFDRQMVTGKADSDLGGRGIYSYFECAIIPALLLGDRRFIESGALRHFGELCLMHCDNSGYMPDTGQNSPDSYPVAALSKCAALLNDGGFLATMPLREQAERAGRFTNTLLEFSAGQAWATGVKSEPMTKMVGVYHLPLTLWEHEVRGGVVPLEKSFDKLTFRTGFGEDDQYLLLDGLQGGPPGKPWPDVNSIAHFGQGGRSFLVSDIGGENPANHNVVTVSRDGLGQPSADLAASLEATANLPRLGYTQTRVARYAFSSWDRHILWRKGGWFFVYDQLTVREPGTYSFECQWRTLGESSSAEGLIESALWDVERPKGSRDVLRIRNAERRPIRYSEQTTGPFGPPSSKAWERYCPRNGINRFRQTAFRRMAAGDRESFANLFYVGGERTRVDYDIHPFSEGAWLLTGSERALLVVGNNAYERGGIRLHARAACLAETSISAIGMIRLEWGGHSLVSSEPVSFECDLASGQLTTEKEQPADITLDGIRIEDRLPRKAAAALASLLRAQLECDRPGSTDGATDAKPGVTSRPAEPLEISPVWTVQAGSEVTCLHAEDGREGSEPHLLVGLADGRVCRFDSRGRKEWEQRLGGPVRALAETILPAGPTVLAGCDDEHVYAVRAEGNQIRWKHKCEVPAERFNAYPWWTTGGKAKIQAIAAADLDGDGSTEVICGTGGGCVECLDHKGARQWLTPIEWGIPDRFAVLGLPNGSCQLLVGNAQQSCGSTTWRLGPDGKLISANAYATGRSTWDMASAPVLKLVDLDGDGRPEAIIGRKGAYNELAVYDAVSGLKRWVQTLADAPEAVDLWDVNGDGKMEILAGSGASWICIFDAQGQQVQAIRMPHEVRAISCGTQQILAACGDGKVYRLGRDGVLSGQYAMKGPPKNHFVCLAGLALIADSSGHVIAFQQE